MTDLKAILTELEEKEAESKLVPEQVDPRVRAGVEAKVRNAIQDLPRIQDKYKEAVMSTVTIIAVTGENAEKFAQIASDTMNALSVDFQLIKSRFVNNLKSRNAGEVYSSNTHFMLLDEVQKVKLEYKVLALPAPVINHYFDGIIDEKLEKAIELLLKKNYGNSLYSAITRREVGKRALEERFAGKNLPVILYNCNGEVDTNFLPTPSFLVDASSDVNVNMVKETLSNMAKTIKGKRKTAKKEDQSEGQE